MRGAELQIKDSFQRNQSLPTIPITQPNKADKPNFNDLYNTTNQGNAHPSAVINDHNTRSVKQLHN